MATVTQKQQVDTTKPTELLKQPKGQLPKGQVVSLTPEQAVERARWNIMTAAITVAAIAVLTAGAAALAFLTGTIGLVALIAIPVGITLIAMVVAGVILNKNHSKEVSLEAIGGIPKKADGQSEKEYISHLQKWFKFAKRHMMPVKQQLDYKSEMKAEDYLQRELTGAATTNQRSYLVEGKKVDFSAAGEDTAKALEILEKKIKESSLDQDVPIDEIYHAMQINIFAASQTDFLVKIMDASPGIQDGKAKFNLFKDKKGHIKAHAESVYVVKTSSAEVPVKSLAKLKVHVEIDLTDKTMTSSWEVI